MIEISSNLRWLSLMIFGYHRKCQEIYRKWSRNFVSPLGHVVFSMYCTEVKYLRLEL